jgi:hypothetical protein
MDYAERRSVRNLWDKVLGHCEPVDIQNGRGGEIEGTRLIAYASEAIRLHAD